MKQKIRSLLLFFMLNIFMVTLLLAVLLVKQEKIAFANSTDNYSDSILYYEDIEDCIEKDSVIITLTEDETKKYKTYTVDDFKEVGCVEIEDLTQFTTNYVKETTRGGYTGESMLVETDNYKRILKLNLNNVGTNNVINAIEVLSKRKDILVAALNYIYTIDMTPDDTFWNNNLWGLNGKHGIQAESAWDITTGDSTVTVGVLDTGIQANHPDLVNRISTAGLHRDCTVNPIATVSNTNLIDPHGHGTHVAGIIGAQGNNSIGISGVCWDIRLVSLRVADENAELNTENLVRAIDFAASNNIPILNYSGGGRGNDSNLRIALENYAGLFVCSAGNGGIDNIGDNNDLNPQYPSSYSYIKSCRDRVISVGAINNFGERAIFSNYGEKSVSIFAPGQDILSTYPTSRCIGGICNRALHYANGYHFNSGTSMAAPHVTGVAALLLSKYPTLTAAELKEIILSNADIIEINTPDGTQKVKKLNAYNALQRLNKTVTFEQEGFPGPEPLILKYGDEWPTITMPTRKGYYLDGYYFMYQTTLYKIYNADGTHNPNNIVSPTYFNLFSGITLVGHWLPENYYFVVEQIHARDTEATYMQSYTLTYDDFFEYEAPERMMFTEYSSGGQGLVAKESRAFTRWIMNLDGAEAYDPVNNPWHIISTDRYLRFYVANLVEEYYPNYTHNYNIHLRAVYLDDYRNEMQQSCIAEGTLITLADGTRVPVEQLKGDEMLLVWNLFTGTFDTAPILFIDYDPAAMYEVINLYFSDGTEVKVISEHAFWDFDLNEYVYLDSNAAEYIGHWFNKQITTESGELYWTKVQLTDVIIQEEYTTAWSPITYGHLCYYVNGMLSIPGGIEGLFNIFEVDGETLTYNSQAMAEDIAQYGLFTYEEFVELLPVPEEIFNAFSGQYLKVAIGKGLINFDTLTRLVERYQQFF